MKVGERLHALDAVRAFALLSGIVLHATMSFMPGLAAFGFPADSSQSPALQSVFYVIHVFRMTLFFFLAGYFARLLFHRKGTADFVRDRAKRIVAPLVVGWVFFGPMAMALVYMSLAPPVPGAPAAPPQGGFPLAHLWFLYYLLLLYGAMLALRSCFNLLDRDGKRRARIDGWMRSLVRGYAAPVLLAAPIAVCLYFTPNWIMWGGIPTPDAGLAPKLPAMIGYGTAFVFGWLLHRQSELLSVWRQRWALHLTLAIGFTALSLWLVQQAPNPFAVESSIKVAYAASYTLAIWNWVLALIGTALRFFSGESAVRRYVADASYWMYLAHLPVVFALQMIVLKWPLHWSVKFPLIVSVTVAVLLLSYRYLVRYTFIGEVLNGRRQRPQVVAKGSTQKAPLSVLSGNPSPIVAELTGVHKRYGDTVALDGVDLQVRRGEVLALLGPNGAGKSTSISLLLGLQQPDSGSVSLFGEAPDASESIEARRQVGVMLQEVTLPPEMRVRELIELTSSYYSSPLAIDEVMTLTRTASLANRPYGKLSGGQQRLAQFAMAVCGRPKLLFLDEPTTGLDIQAREMLWSTIRQLVQDGCSIVLTTHYLEEAEALADRIVVITKGRVVAQGSVNEVRAVVSRKLIRCITTLSAEHIRHWPGVMEVSAHAQRLHIAVNDAESVARRLLIGDPSLRELEVTRAGLAEAFVELTRQAA
jgi:ABC-type multidrug transport system ATPase subunit/peptidoglycan/LPS O-acetylase OafA/YrhL